jgi:hypothetical protein
MDLLNQDFGTTVGFFDLVLSELKFYATGVIVWD